MYFYLYDAYLNHQKYEGTLAKIENRLIDLGINGKVERLSLLKSVVELVTEGIKTGALTVVAVGNDDTFKKVLNVLAKYHIAMGFIPIGTTSHMARVLGIPPEEKACDVLSARLTEKIDLGKVNNHYFFSAVEIPAKQMVSIEFDGKFHVTPLHFRDTITVSNMGPILGRSEASSQNVRNPKDGLLEVTFQPLKGGVFTQKKMLKPSVFLGKKLNVTGGEQKITMVADGKTVLQGPATIEILPKRLKLIVGKNRLF